MWEYTAPGSEFPLMFCAGIGSLLLGVVLVFSRFQNQNSICFSFKRLDHVLFFCYYSFFSPLPPQVTKDNRNTILPEILASIRERL